MRGEVWPCLGRDAELDVIRRSLSRGRTVAVVGAAGMGKSHLARTLLDELGARRIPTHRVIGTPAASRVPLGALASMPSAAPVAGPPGPDAAARIADALGSGLRGPRAPVLLVDDAHHLDETSAAVLLDLASDDRVRLLLTVRTGEPQPSALTTLWSEPGVERLDLGPLDPVAVEAVAEHLLGGPLDGGTLRQFVDASGGNPLLLRELLHGSFRGGALVGDAGLWRLTTEIGGTPLLEELLLARLDPLPPEERSVLELVAVAGALDLVLLEEVADLTVAEQLERTGLLAVAADAGGDGTVELGHPLYADLLLARLPVLARRRISRQLADAADGLSTRGRTSPVAELRSTLWRLDGGGSIDPDRALTAARQLADVGDTALAARLAEAAFDHGGGIGAALMASWCLAERGEHAAAEVVLERASGAATDPFDVALLTLRRAEERFWGARQADEARDLLTTTGERLPEGPPRDVLAAQLAVFSVLEGRVDDALGQAEPHLASPDVVVRAVAAIAAETALAAAGRSEEAIELADRTFEEVLADGDRPFGDPGIHVIGRMAGLVAAGRLDEGSELMAFVYDMLVGRPDRQARAWVTTFWSQCEILRGHLTEALRYAVESEVLWLDCGVTGPARWAAGAAALAQVQLGRADEARATVERLGAYPAAPFLYGAPLVDRAVAWLAAADGDAGAARRVLTGAVATCLATGRIDMAGHVAHELARVGEADAARAAFAGIPDVGPLGTAHRAQAVALADGNADGLEHLGEVYRALGARLDAAESFAAAATAHRSPAAAERCTRARDGEVATLGCAPVTPLLAGAKDAAASLSGRERDVARLAARGLSNRQIAEHLVISERTVENHLYRIFRKLHIGSRADLADVFGDGVTG